MDIIYKYFPDLTKEQQLQLTALFDLYQEWNVKINVISRKDIDQLYLRHVLHSMSIAKWIRFVPGTRILDVGCGGGLPGIPLAILFPETRFHLVDSVGKKLTVVQDIALQIGLSNIRTTHSRVENIHGKYDFVVSRAVASLSQLFQWTRKNIATKHINSIPNGLVALKGGDLSEELKSLPRGEYSESVPISNYINESYYKEKYIIYVQG